MNYIEIDGVLRTWIESQYLHPNVMTGDIYQNLNTGELKYPIVNIDLSSVNRESDMLYYSFYIYYVDRLNEDCGNEKQLQTDGINSLNLLINKIRISDNQTIQLPVNITPIRQQFVDNLAGAWCELRIGVATSLNHCMEDGITPISIKIDGDGKYDVRGLDEVTVDTSDKYEPLSVSANGTYSAASKKKYGFSRVTVDTSDKYEPLSVTANGTYTASGSGLYGYSNVTVDVHEANTIKANGLSASLPGSTELLSVIGNPKEICSGVTEVVSTIPIKYNSSNVAFSYIFPNMTKADITCTEDSSGMIFINESVPYTCPLKTIIIRGDFPINTTINSGTWNTSASTYSLESVSFPDLTKTASRNYGQSPIVSGYRYVNINKVEFPKLVEANRALIGQGEGLWKLTELELPECTAINRDITAGAQNECPALTRIYAPKATHFVSNYDDFIAYTDYFCPRNLIDVEIGDADNGYYLNENIRMYRYKPVNVLADAALTAQMNENIRNHIAYNCEDRTGKSALTITFRTETYNALEEATKLAFTNKGWLVASLS